MRPRAPEVYVPPNPKSMPKVVWLTIDANSKLAKLGFALEGPAIEHERQDIFSEAHYFIQEYFEDMLKEAVNFEQDWDGALYPEIKKAWKLAGKAPNSPMVATCAKFGKWAVGFGGKVNASRAVKLALAAAIAKDGDATKTAAVVKAYPRFGKFLDSVNGKEPELDEPTTSTQPAPGLLTASSPQPGLLTAATPQPVLQPGLLTAVPPQPTVSTQVTNVQTEPETLQTHTPKLKVGDRVQLVPNYRDFGDASEGPLQLGEAAEILATKESSVERGVIVFRVREWWYKEEALQKVGLSALLSGGAI